MPAEQTEPSMVLAEVLRSRFPVTRESKQTLAVYFDSGIVYVTVSDRPPVESEELAELQEMDRLLKAAMTRPGDGIDAKTLREIIGERRQLQKQMSSLRTALNSGGESEAKGKLDALRNQSWDADGTVQP